MAFFPTICPISEDWFTESAVPSSRRALCNYLLSSSHLSYSQWRAGVAATCNARMLFCWASRQASLVSYHLLIHDLTIMIVPLFLVLDHCLFSEGKGQNLFRTSALVLAAPILMAVSAAHFYLIAIPVSIFAVLLMHSGKSAQREQGSLLPRSLPLSFGS